MVDALYDAQVTLVLSAAVPLEELFVSSGADSHADKFGDVIGNIVQDSGDETFAVRRTLSRLQEMRSQAYVSRSASRGLLMETLPANATGPVRGDQVK